MGQHGEDSALLDRWHRRGMHRGLHATRISGMPVTNDVNPLGVLASIAAAVAGWVQAKDHASLSRAYGIAAQELGLARARLVSETDSRA
jgi:hypothetical protein